MAQIKKLVIGIMAMVLSFAISCKKQDNMTLSKNNFNYDAYLCASPLKSKGGYIFTFYPMGNFDWSGNANTYSVKNDTFMIYNNAPLFGYNINYIMTLVNDTMWFNGVDQKGNKEQVYLTRL